MDGRRFVSRLGAAEIGGTYNFYRDGERAPILRSRLRAYLEVHARAPFLLVGEAAGYRGARVSGIPFTSERQLTGTGPAEASATIVHRVLDELGVTERTLLWNVVPTHPGTESSNRTPTRPEIEAARPFLVELARGRRVLPVGRLAERALGIAGVRHPSHGGSAAFRAGLVEWLGSDVTAL